MEESRVGRRGNIHVFAKIKMAIVKQPIRKAGVGKQGRALIHSCESFEDKGIQGRG